MKPGRGEHIANRADLEARIVLAEHLLREARVEKQREKAKNIYNQLRRYKRRLATMPATTD